MFEISAATILVLLIFQDLISVSNLKGSRRIGRILYLPIIGLLIVFLIASVIRVIGVIS